MIKKIKKKILLLHKTIYIYLFNIAFAVVSFSIVYILISQHIEAMSLKSIKIIGDIKVSKIESLLEGFKYELLHGSSDSDIISMDREKISKRVGFIKYYKRFYKDMIIINNKNEVLSGYLHDVKEYMYSDYIIEAKKGKTSVSEPIQIEGEWYIDVASPIMNNGECIGIVAIRLSLLEISGHLKSHSQDENMEMYIVNRDGYFLTGGRNNLRKIGVENINISSLKHSIDYDKKATYKNYDGDSVYGKYYDLSIGGWTLVVEMMHSRVAFKYILLISSFIIVFILFLMNKIISIAYKHRNDM